MSDIEITDDHLVYLDMLRDSGTVNMFGAAPFVMDQFGLNAGDARKVVTHWMKTFSERHPK